jgi:hypothetical protein
MPTFERRGLEINEISACKKGANPGAKIFLFKADNEENKMLEIDKIEDAELKKEVESFIKEQEDKADKLQEQFDTLQKEHEELKEQAEKEDETVEDKVEKLPEDMKKAWTEAQEQIKKAQEDATKATEEVAKMREDNLRKEVSTSVDELPRIVTPDDRKQFVEIAMKMDEKDRSVYLDSLAKAEQVAGKNESLFKEMGNSQAPAGEAEDRIDVVAKELLAKGDAKTIESARVMARDINPDLRKEERAEIERRNK